MKRLLWRITFILSCIHFCGSECMLLSYFRSLQSKTTGPLSFCSIEAMKAYWGKAVMLLYWGYKSQVILNSVVFSLGSRCPRGIINFFIHPFYNDRMYDYFGLSYTFVIKPKSNILDGGPWSYQMGGLWSNFLSV